MGKGRIYDYLATDNEGNFKTDCKTCLQKVLTRARVAAQRRAAV